MDGMFGAYHYKKSGRQCLESHHKGRLFEDDKSVKAFVDKYPSKVKKSDQVSVSQQ